MPSATTDAQMQQQRQLAREFLRQYYACVNGNQAEMYRFYTPHAVVAHAALLGAERVDGRVAVKAKLAGVTARGPSAVIHAFEAIDGRAAGQLIIHVQGHLCYKTDKADTERYFTQTIVLKREGERAYFVDADVFSFNLPAKTPADTRTPAVQCDTRAKRVDAAPAKPTSGLVHAPAATKAAPATPPPDEPVARAPPTAVATQTPRAPMKTACAESQTPSAPMKTATTQSASPITHSALSQTEPAVLSVDVHADKQNEQTAPSKTDTPVKSTTAAPMKAVAPAPLKAAAPAPMKAAPPTSMKTEAPAPVQAAAPVNVKAVAPTSGTIAPASITTTAPVQPVASSVTSTCPNTAQKTDTVGPNVVGADQAKPTPATVSVERKAAEAPIEANAPTETAAPADPTPKPAAPADPKPAAPADATPKPAAPATPTPTSTPRTWAALTAVNRPTVLPKPTIKTTPATPAPVDPVHKRVPQATSGVERKTSATSVTMPDREITDATTQFFFRFRSPPTNFNASTFKTACLKDLNMDLSALSVDDFGIRGAGVTPPAELRTQHMTHADGKPSVTVTLLLDKHAALRQTLREHIRITPNNTAMVSFASINHSGFISAHVPSPPRTNEWTKANPGRARAGSTPTWVGGGGARGGGLRRGGHM